MYKPLYGVFTLGVLLGCMREENPPTAPADPPGSATPVSPGRAWTPGENAALVDKLANQGFRVSDIVDEGQSFLVEGDIRMLKEDVEKGPAATQQASPGGALAKTAAHYRSQYAVRDNK